MARSMREGPRPRRSTLGRRMVPAAAKCRMSPGSGVFARAARTTAAVTTAVAHDGGASGAAAKEAITPRADETAEHDQDDAKDDLPLDELHDPDDDEDGGDDPEEGGAHECGLVSLVVTDYFCPERDRTNRPGAGDGQEVLLSARFVVSRWVGRR